jgi:hypothetical protein
MTAFLAGVVVGLVVGTAFAGWLCCETAARAAAELYWEEQEYEDATSDLRDDAMAWPWEAFRRD